MSDPMEEGKQGAAGTVDANPPASVGQAQPSTPDITALMTRLEALEKQNKALQSGKDKRWNEVMPVIKQVAAVLGIDESKVAEAQEKAVLQELVAERMGRLQPQGGTGTTTPQAAQVDVQSIAKQYGLDPNSDAGFLSALVGESDHEKVELKIARYARQKVAQPNPSSATSPAPTGGTSASQSGAELVGEYKTKMLAARGNKALGQQIKEEYRKRGCPVDSVIFGV